MQLGGGDGSIALTIFHPSQCLFICFSEPNNGTDIDYSQLH